MFTSRNIFVALTYKCNAFCKKCMTRYHVNRNLEMSEITLDRLISLLKSNNYTGYLSVGTGEPLLYERLNTFIEETLNINKDLRLRLLTNGMALNSKQDPVIFNKRCKWGVTMDGFFNESLFSLQKGVDVEKVKLNIALVAENYGPEALYLNFTVNNKNIKDVPKFCAFAVKLGIKDIYLTKLKIFEGYENDLKDFAVMENDANKNIINEAKLFLKENGISSGGIDIFSKHNRSMCYLSGRMSPMIDVDGSVSFCSGREDIIVGNIMDRDINVKWEEFLQSVRKSKEVWCENCYDKSRKDGIFRLPKTIKREAKK